MAIRELTRLTRGPRSLAGWLTRFDAPRPAVRRMFLLVTECEADLTDVVRGYADIDGELSRLTDLAVSALEDVAAHLLSVERGLDRLGVACDGR